MRGGDCDVFPAARSMGVVEAVFHAWRWTCADTADASHAPSPAPAHAAAHMGRIGWRACARSAESDVPTVATCLRAHLRLLRHRCGMSQPRSLAAGDWASGHDHALELGLRISVEVHALVGVAGAACWPSHGAT